MLFNSCSDQDDPITDDISDHNNSNSDSTPLLDADNDGVADTDDTCADTPSGTPVDSAGCSDSQKDTDADGVTDDLDLCPDNTQGAVINENGCPDTDGDLVFDNNDDCPETPQGADIDVNGCSYVQNLTIGDIYQGGIIVYLFSEVNAGYITGEVHGIIATRSDQSNEASWGCQGESIEGAEGTTIGAGAQNTVQILAGCSELEIAAKLCQELVLNGYEDWYLPSQDELNLLFINKETIGGFAGIEYWSSTESRTNDAWGQGFGVGDQYTLSKSSTISVRAVRKF
tara:strand:+ start:4335 stop:5189 length:855 start_codon:yes stop_codon:yes gene_type:complete